MDGQFSLPAMLEYLRPGQKVRITGLTQCRYDADLGFYKRTHQQMTTSLPSNILRRDSSENRNQLLGANASPSPSNSHDLPMSRFAGDGLDFRRPVMSGPSVCVSGGDSFLEGAILTRKTHSLTSLILHMILRVQRHQFESEPLLPHIDAANDHKSKL